MTTPIVRTALVTGANRGIGLQICKQLARRGMRVMLASRDEHKGAAALRSFAKAEPETAVRITVCQLDVTDDDSVLAARAEVERAFGRLDALVNNAAILIDDEESIFEVDLAKVRATMESNFYGPLRMCRALVPLMAAQGYGRVVNVSSEMGQLSGMGGRTSAYSMSKTALNAMTVIMAAETGRYPNVKVNSCCPGWVRTDMGGPRASKSVEEGADTPVWLATLPDDGPTGGFFQNRRRIDW